MDKMPAIFRGAWSPRHAVSHLVLATALGLGTAAAAAPPTDTVQEVVVTAQRREQNVQDVPIAVTALTQQAITVNRVSTVNDLSLLAPGLTVVPAAGGTQIPTFTMRGLTSYGVVPGSDKAISVYLDGVYISSTRGSIFDLPDISQIDVLRGPQGTLFGRNATAGAVSITTRDPSGNFSVQQDFTVGNEDQFRSRTSINFPAWGPFSAYVSYVHNYQRGDVQNAGAGTVWDYSNATTPAIHKTEVSPKWLGTVDSNSFFGALKYAPNDRFSTVDRFDYSLNNGTPGAVSFLGADLSGPAGPLLGFLLATNPVLTAGAQRPNVVNNAFTIPSPQVNAGDSLTSTYQGDNFTIKNIAAYRYTFLTTANQLDGLGGLQLPVAPGVSVPFTVLGITNFTQGHQWSDELNYVYRSKLLTLTVGGIFFRSNDINGGIPGVANNVAFTPGLTILPGVSSFYNQATSIAGYTQAEFHVTSYLDVVGGFRETQDWKSGTADLFPALPNPNFTYSNSRPSFLAGVNYKPTSDILLYGKFSTAFVSGGDVGGIPFLPETVESWEAGFKGEFFDHRLRTNIALYDATYHHLQDPEGGSTYAGSLLNKYPFIPLLGTFIVDQGGSDVARGVEFEGTVVVAHGLTAGTDISYDHARYFNVDPAVDNPAGVTIIPTLLPPWTVGLWGQYQTKFGKNLTGTVRIDADYRAALPLSSPKLGIPAYANYLAVPSTWLVNGRAAIGGFKLGGVDAEFAVWAKNLTNDRSLTYALLIPQVVGAGNYQPARTFGLDLHFKY